MFHTFHALTNSENDKKHALTKSIKSATNFHIKPLKIKKSSKTNSSLVFLLFKTYKSNRILINISPDISNDLTIFMFNMKINKKCTLGLSCSIKIVNYLCCKNNIV